MMLMTLLAAATLVGHPAPGFSLPDDRGGTTKLASFKGKQPVVLAFFPKAFTPG
jgi:peroxiredoxin Q/BCP